MHEIPVRHGSRHSWWSRERKRVRPRSHQSASQGSGFATQRAEKLSDREPCRNIRPGRSEMGGPVRCYIGNPAPVLSCPELPDNCGRKCYMPFDRSYHPILANTSRSHSRSIPNAEGEPFSPPPHQTERPLRHTRQGSTQFVSVKTFNRRVNFRPLILANMRRNNRLRIRWVHV